MGLYGTDSCVVGEEEKGALSHLGVLRVHRD